MKLYLDSSALVKRYLEERGTETIDKLFEYCWVGRHSVSYSAWNIGECIEALDERRGRGEVTEEELRVSLNKFVGEAVALLEVRRLVVIPVTGKILGRSWSIILSEHVYEADALQISACVEAKCDGPISADNRLVSIACKAGLKAFNIESGSEAQALGQIMTARSTSH